MVVAAMFSTLEYSKQLQAARVPQDQADAHAEVQVNYVIEPILGRVATKDDLAHQEIATKAAFEQLEKATAAQFERFEKAAKVEFERQEKATKAKFEQFGEVIRADLAFLEKKMTIHLGGMIITSVAALAALNQFVS